MMDEIQTKFEIRWTKFLLSQSLEFDICDVMII
jgi:hypothetical protein